MGLFHNYEKPGPGVNKNAKRAKGFALFFELYFRKLGSYLQLNLFYFTSLIPSIAIIWHLIMTILNDFSTFGEDTAMAGFIFSAVLAIALSCAFGLSPFSAGFHYVLRNFSFEKHAFVFSDFIEKFRENKKNSIIMFITDLAVVCISLLVLRFYFILSTTSPLFVAPFTLLIIVLIVYSLMTPYKWTMLVTFDLNKKQIYKNALLFVLGDAKTTLKHFFATFIYVLISIAAIYINFLVGLILFVFLGVAAFGLIAQLNIYKQMQDFISQSPGGHENIN